MDDKMKKKNIILSLVIVLVGMILAGGTYAYLTFSMNVTNNVVSGSSTCFNIDYTNNTDQITGTLFPSAIPSKGLTGVVSLKVNNVCDLEGVGNIYLHVNANTSNTFITTSAAHCENKNTLETLTQYMYSNVCFFGGEKWVTNGTPLKYAVYDNSNGTGTPLSVGYVNAIDSDIAIYERFIITKTQKNYYIFLWLDGNLTDNTYTNLSFSGYIKANAIQSRVVYTANLIDDPEEGRVRIGQPIPNGITEYRTPEEAMAALIAAYGGADLPFFLKHIVENNVALSYVGFVITPEMVEVNPGMVAGTYYLKGGDGGMTSLDTAKTIYDAFGGVGCHLDDRTGVNPYTTTTFSQFNCFVPGLRAYVSSDGHVYVNDDENAACYVGSDSSSGCGEL